LEGEAKEMNERFNKEQMKWKDIQHAHRSTEGWLKKEGRRMKETNEQLGGEKYEPENENEMLKVMEGDTQRR
jgi:hypothetical protein